MQQDALNLSHLHQCTLLLSCPKTCYPRTATPVFDRGEGIEANQPQPFTSALKLMQQLQPTTEGEDRGNSNAC